MLLWFADLMNVTEEFTIHRPNVLTLLSSAFIRGDLTMWCDDGGLLPDAYLHLVRKKKAAN